MLKFSKYFLLPGLLCAGLFSSIPARDVLFASKESKTLSGGPVFNKVHFEVKGDKDIWMMQQSHDGLAGAYDRLAIVVDKKARQARFYQLEPGPLVWTGQEKTLPLKIACYLCHSNGPRAIRADFTYPGISSTWLDRLQVAAWNLKIKTYGRIQPDPLHLEEGKLFRAQSAFANEPLRLKTCSLCHNEKWWGRGTLTRQNFMSIRFLVKNNQMPPPGIPFPDHEKEILVDFIRGLQ